MLVSSERFCYKVLPLRGGGEIPPGNSGEFVWLTLVVIFPSYSFAFVCMCAFGFSFHYLIIKCIDPKYIRPLLLLTVLSHGHDYFREGKLEVFKILKDQNNFRAM